MRLGQKIPTSLFISNQTLTRLLIELFVRLLDSKMLLIILAGLGLRNRDFVYRFLSHRLLREIFLLISLLKNKLGNVKLTNSMLD